MSERFDILFRRANIYDGLGGEPFEGEVAIRGDEIAAVRRSPADGDLFSHSSNQSPDLTAQKEIDLNGQVLCPGFIDIHSHSDYSLLINPLAESKVRQGVTTEVGGNCGYSAAPISGKAREERRNFYKKRYDIDPKFSEVKDYLRQLEESGISVNYIHQVGHNTIRQSVMGGADRPPSQVELNKMVEMVELGLSQGAFGISTGLVYAPACFATIDETSALVSAAGKKSGFFSVHMRSEGAELVESIDEVLAVSRKSGTRLQISHLKTAGRKNWNKIEEAFEHIELAAASGVDVACDRYPYTASNTHLSALLPNWALEGEKTEVLARLNDETNRQRICGILEERNWEHVVISLVSRSENKQFEGKSVSFCAKERGMKPEDFAIYLLVAEDLWVEILLLHLMDETNLRKILKKPYVLIGSDAEARAHYGVLGEGVPHPRGFGTFPRVLGQLVRGEGLMPLSEAIARMTWLPAQRVRLPHRGCISPGMKADLVVFDPDQIHDAATFESSIRYPVGIRYVMVNGQLTVDGDLHLGARAGLSLRINDSHHTNGKPSEWISFPS